MTASDNFPTPVCDAVLERNMQSNCPHPNNWQTFSTEIIVGGMSEKKPKFMRIEKSHYCNLMPHKTEQSWFVLDLIECISWHI